MIPVVNDSLIDAFIVCKHKSFLKRSITSERQAHDFEVLHNQLKEHYKKRFIDAFLKNGFEFTYCQYANFNEISAKQPGDYLVPIRKTLLLH
jgi:hypothetical protein